MELTRIIHPVGQGTFYTETIFNGKEYFNIVYDCGSETKKQSYKKSTIEYRIDCYLSLLREQQNIKQTSKPKINAIFISHFHDDHVNGLAYLLNNANVEYLFIPQLTEEQAIEFVVYNIINNQESNISNLIFNILNKNLNKDIAIIEVKNELLENDEKDRNKRTNISSISSSTIFSGTKIYSTVFEDWLYILYNPKIVDNIKLKELRENLENEFNEGKEFSYKNLPNIIKSKEQIEKCREIYGKIFGKNNHNSYSMTLFSGQEHPKQLGIKKINRNFYNICDNLNLWKCCNNYIVVTPNCLYTGDFEVKNNFNELKNFYSNLKLWNTIQTIQVPHHCS